MKKIFKGLLFLVFSLLLVITIASCSSNDLDWKITKEDIESSIELKQEVVVSNNVLKVNINNQEDIFNDDLEKSYVKVLDFNSKLNDEIKLDDYKVDFNFNKESNKKIEIEINDYKDTMYTIIVNKKGMKNNVYGVSIVNLKNNELVILDKYIELESNNYYVNEENPVFSISYRNYEVKNINDLEFSDAFSKLEVSKVLNNTETKTISIETTGKISNDTFGTIILKKDFFNDLEEDINLVSNVELIEGFVNGIDVSNPDLFKVNLKLVNQKVKDNLNVSDISLSKDVVISSVTVDSLDKSLITLVLNPKTNNKAFNDELDNTTISIDGNKLTSNKDVEIVYNSLKPSLSLIKILDGNKLNIFVKAINATIENKEAITGDLDDYDITPTITKTENKSEDIYKLEFVLTEVGTISGSVDAIITDIFGVDDIISVSFSLLHPALESTNTDIQKFNEDVIEAEVDSKQSFASAMMFILYAAQIGVSISTYGNPCAAMGSIIAMLNFCGVSKGLIPSSPSIADVMKQLDIMNKKLDEISEKLDRLSETIKEESAAIQMGIDKALYVIYKSSWENFYNGSINELDNILRDYGNAYRTFLTNEFRVIDNNSNLEVFINYCNETDDKGQEHLVICEPSKINPEYSTSGKEVVDVKQVIIPGSYLNDLYLSLNQKGYTDEFDTLLQEALEEYMKDNPDLNIPHEDIYNAILSNAQKNVITKDLSNKITNAFCNFARGVYYNGNSQLTNFFGMVESLYNFQTEARLSIDSMRASLKNQLIVYGSFVSLFAEYSENQIDKDEVTTLIDDACKYIKAYSGNRSANYSYITKTNVSTALLKLKITAVFYNPGIGCEFNTYFTPCYMIDADSYGIFDYFNNQALVDQAAILKMRARFDIIKTMNADLFDKTFEEYLIGLGILKDWNSTYQTLRQRNKGKALPEKLTVITSYDGISSADDSGNNYVCSSNGWGDYFKVGNVYQYKGSQEKDCWSGGEAKGTIFTFSNMVSYGNIITRYARYDESHCYWFTDEHHSFEMYSNGFFTLAFYKA